MKKYIIAGILFSNICLASTNPISLASDNRIKVVAYNPDNVVNIRGMTFVNTQVQFGADEKIADIQCGDATSWSVFVSKSNQNMLNIKPVAVGSNTDMTVSTVDGSGKKRGYYFHLTSDENSKDLPITYAIKFKYPLKIRRMTEDRLAYKRGQGKATLSASYSPARFNYNYSFSGSHRNMPLHVFDDGRFTYFQFQSNQNIPAIFAVHNKDGKEAVVDYRINGNTVTVLQVSPQFTLRNYNQATSIFNSSLIKKIKRRG